MSDTSPSSGPSAGASRVPGPGPAATTTPGASTPAGTTPTATPTGAAPTGFDLPATRVVAVTASYADAERAVDRLSDAGFPVSTVSIVGRGLNSVERVTGRVTAGRAALVGAGSGAWFGLFLGLLLGLFLPAPAWLALLLTAVVLGAVWGAVFGFLAHAVTGGRRDFSSVQRFVADQYEVHVSAERADEAARILARAA